jgi:NADH-quinone oxidoreductase subunit J
MSASAIIFYIIGTLVLTFGILTVFTRRIFRAAVYLLLTLIGIAGIYILLDMQFVAALQIVIYVGGIVVIIIFSVFLTAQSGEKLPTRNIWKTLTSMILPVSGFVFTLWIIVCHVFKVSDRSPVEPTVKNIGSQLLNYNKDGYVFPFEVVSVLLLAALIGSVVIAMKTKREGKE